MSKKPRASEPRFDIRTPLHHLTGVDLTQLDAIGPYSALRLLAEIGTDIDRWPTAKHFHLLAHLGAPTPPSCKGDPRCLK